MWVADGGQNANLRYDPATGKITSFPLPSEHGTANLNTGVFDRQGIYWYTGQGGVQSAMLSTLLKPESTFFNVAAGLTQPILDGWLLQGQLDLAVGHQDEQLQLYRKAIINGFTDVDQALSAIQETTRREQLQRAVVASSRRAFDIAEIRLREGTVDLVTVLQTQQTLFQAQDLLAQVRLARLQAVVSLYQALGGGWSPAVPADPI